MPVFGDYARYYNLLYQDKDYVAESTFILNCLHELGCNPQTVLDLGCGTGRHALEVAQRGLLVTGVDISETMLAMGRENLAQLKNTPQQLFVAPKFSQGDARKVRLGHKFDTVISMFHVMSYQNSEEDALAVFATAFQHLQPGGIFLFDFWYGPGVLTDPPTERYKIVEDDDLLVKRHAVPYHRVNDNIVEVNYSIQLERKHHFKKNIIKESHQMRYWFIPELRYLARQAGFLVLGQGSWMESKKEPDAATWNAWMALKHP